MFFGLLINIKMKKVYKVLLTLICLSGLIYQFFETLNNYMQGKTMVNVLITNGIVDDTFPAITICTKLYSFYALANVYEDFRILWNKNANNSRY